MKGSTYYHGTNKKNANKILKTGFKPGTYFTWDLHSALTMGGKYVFGIYFSDKKPKKDYWEWRNIKTIGPQKILYLRKFQIQCLYDNQKEQEKMSFAWKKEYYGKNIVHCENCRGQGQINPVPLPPYKNWKKTDLLFVKYAEAMDF